MKPLYYKQAIGYVSKDNDRLAWIKEFYGRSKYQIAAITGNEPGTERHRIKLWPKRLLAKGLITIEELEQIKRKNQLQAQHRN